MTRALAALMILPGILLFGPALAADEAGNWLMLVGTSNLDPAHEAAFNHWYDDIDIPDVFKVAGYLRARRGLRQEVAGFSSGERTKADGRYLALYDIDTTSIDRTIIDMLLMAKRMDMAGRSIDALRVTERTYLRRHGSVAITDKSGAAGGTYLYLERVSCCRDDATAAALDDWYDNVRIPAMERAPPRGLRRISRYEVYRVVMAEPRQVPRFLAVYEFEADSAPQVVDAMRATNDRMAKDDRLSPWFVEDGSDVFSLIRDVHR
jgi:hypothetical protein